MTRARQLAWLAVPLLAYAALLQHFWVNAPIWDDYGSILESMLRMMDARTFGDWIGAVVAQHNEHRIAAMRLAARALIAIFGHLDFRLLVLAANLSFLGLFLMVWDEFRDAVAAPLFCAAAFLMFQWSYFEAGLWTTGGLGNMGVAAFGFACIWLATWRGRLSALGCIASGLVSVGLAASGLFALPIAAGACFLAKQRARALLFAAVAAVLWLLYFHGYARPPNHPSPLVALNDPGGAFHLFLIVVGGIAPGRVPATYAGVAVLAALAWVTWKGEWKRHPIAAYWTLFVLATAASAAIGRIGFGVYHASRYAAYSTCLVVLAFLAIASATRPWTRTAMAVAIAACALASFGATAAVWGEVRQFALNGHLLAKLAAPADGDASHAYFGMYFPNASEAGNILAASEAHGIYSPPEVILHPATTRWSERPAAGATTGGFLDEVHVSGRHVEATGWSAIPATIPGRVVSIISRPAPESTKVVTTERDDVARVLVNPAFVFSGLRIDMDFADDEAAREAAQSLCVTVEAPGHPATILHRAGCEISADGAAR